MGGAEMKIIAKWIVEAIEHRSDAAKLADIRGQVGELTEKFPLYPWLRQ
jgi:glycine hydroxymethyltransferase